jgi:ankyrin repeat protein
MNPFHLAVHNNSIECAQILLQAEADVNTQTTDGKTPLHSAAVMNYVECIQLLIQGNADVNIQDIEGATPLHYAVTFNNTDECVQLLIQANADVNIQDIDGATPLHIAAYFGKLSIERTQLLVQAKANLNIQDSNGATPLHIVCEKSVGAILMWCFSPAMLLLYNGADPIMQNYDLKTPLELVTIQEERLALYEFAEKCPLQCWRRRREVILLQHSVVQSSSTMTHDAASLGVKVLRNGDVFRHLVKFG